MGFQDDQDYEDQVQTRNKPEEHVCCAYVAMWPWDQESSAEYNDLEMTLDSMGLLALIKKLVYTGGANNKHIQHNKAMTIMKLMTLYQDKLQEIQEFRDQYMAIRKVCSELGISFGRCKDHTKAMLTKQGITEPTTAQLKDTIKKVEDELHAIIFMYKTDRAR